MTTLRSFVNDLDKIVQQGKASQAAKIASGSLPNMEQYHRQCGRIEGMEQCVKLARDMLGQMEAAIEDDPLPTMQTGEAQ